MPELLQPFLNFIVLNFLLLATANTVIWRFFSQELRDSFDWVIMMFIMVSAEVLLILGFVGLLGQLNLLAMAAGTVLCFLLGGLRIPWLGRYWQLGWTGAAHKLRQLIFRHQKPDGQEWIGAVFGFLVLYGAIELFNAFVQYPWEYDSIAYHMPIIVEWLQAESLWNVLYAVWGGGPWDIILPIMSFS